MSTNLTMAPSGQRSPSLPRVALYGTFDVLNFGDLLFPHLVRHGLGPERHVCLPISPTQATLPWADTVAPRPIGDPESLTAGLHLIGGGNIIHAGETPLPAYDAAALGRRGAYASLWLGASLLAVRAGAALAWNAPGVPSLIQSEQVSRLRDEVLAAADYVCVRDQASATALNAPPNLKPVVVPDTALDIARMWPAAMLRPIAEQAFRNRGRSTPEAWFVVHLNDRYLDADLPATAALIADMARALDALPVLLALGPCHGDDALARRFGALLDGNALVVDQPAGLKEIAALIAFAAAYAGSSLHGLITALSYGRPGLAVAHPRMIKFNGFLDHVGMAQRLCPSWSAARQAAAKVLQPLDGSAIAAIAAAQSSIGQHWSHLRALLHGGIADRTAPARRRLNAWLDRAPAGYQDWRAIQHVLQDSQPILPAPAIKPEATCNICGGARFRDGPLSRFGEIGSGATCLTCGTSGRHRALRTVLAALPTAVRQQAHCLRFGRSRVADPGLFRSLRDVPVDDLTGEGAAALTASADIVACVDTLEKVPDPGRVLYALLNATRGAGFCVVAEPHIPGCASTIDWGFPRNDRNREFRKLGLDFEEQLPALLPGAAIVGVSPVDPVTGLQARAYLGARRLQDLTWILGSDIGHDILADGQTLSAATRPAQVAEAAGI